MSEEDDVPHLSAETFLILQEFYKEQDAKEVRLSAEDRNGDFEEDWQLSQFWYDDKTIDVLVDVAAKSVKTDGKIALISCPSLYKKLKAKAPENCEIHIYEYDQRFASLGSDFIPYDYKTPLDIPRDKSSYYDLVIADPPFLSDECLTKTALTIKFLTKDKIILCTGAVMADMAERLLDLKKSSFEPHHKNNLANEFWCYTNLDCLL